MAEAPTTAAEGNDVRITAAAGEHGKGEFRCIGCAYSVTVCRELPPCPQCGGTAWQAVSWRPFARAHENG